MSKFIVRIIFLFLLLTAVIAHADPEWEQYHSKVLGEWNTYRKNTVDHWNQYAKKLMRKWGDKTVLPGKKQYAEYFSNDQERVQIDYEKGQIRVESLGKPQAMTHDQALSMVKTLIDEGLLDKKEIPDQPSWESKKDEITGQDGITRQHQTLEIKMADNHLEIRIRRYLPMVLKYSQENNVDPALVLAVIERESAFNPKARSWVPAYGLMQIVPASAGAEVLHEAPSEEYLYDPENNVRVGTAYLKRLYEVHFPETLAPENKLYLVTCSYNWGPHRIRKAIQRGWIDPAAAPEALFNNLLVRVPSETREYLRRVTTSYKRYHSLLL